MTVNGHSCGRSCDDSWKAYWNSGKSDVGARNELVEHYLPLIQRCAKALADRMPRTVEIEDLESVGFFGLVDAIKGFNKGRGVKFEIYASYRIRGAMRDWLRSLDLLPRFTRHRSRVLDSTTNKLRMRLGREPDLDEIRLEMGIPSREFEKILGDSDDVTTSSLSQPIWIEANRQTVRADLIPIKDETGILTGLSREDFKRFAVANLNRVQKIIILLYVFEEYSLIEIGNMLGLSESRVSQICTLAMDIMRSNSRLHDLLDGNK